MTIDSRFSPPLTIAAVEHIRVRNCEFRRGHGVMTPGSEAAIIRDAIVG